MAETDASDAGAGETGLREAIADMPAPHRELGQRIHEIVIENAPSFTPRTWYGMPAYEHDGATVCFFRSDGDFMTFGFTEHATLEPEADAEHRLIPAAWFFTELDEPSEAELAAIVRRARN